MVKLYYSANIKNGERIIDTSPTTGIFIFKPNIELQRKLNQHDISFDEYRSKYIAKMRYSWKNNMDMWSWFLKQKEIVFGCDCNKEHVCHTKILVCDIYAKLGATPCGNFEEKDLLRF